MLRFEELPTVNSKEWLNLKDFKGEEWRDVSGFEGVYKVSNYGRIKTLRRPYRGLHGGYVRERIVKFGINVRGGYCTFTETDSNGCEKTVRVHRVVAAAFIPNPNNYPQINHKDENVKNNCVYNLEWCTNLYNARYGSRNVRTGKSNMIPVIGINVIDGSEIRYDGMADAERLSNKYFNKCCIHDCIYGRQKTHKGYIWKFIDT